MSKKDQIQNLLDRVNQEVAGLGNVERKQILMALKQAEAELSVGLAEWLKKGPGAETRFTAKHYRQALAQIKGVRATWGQVGSTMADSLTKGSASSVALSYEHIREQWEKFSFVFDGELKPLPVSVAARLPKVAKGLERRYAVMGRKFSKETRQWITRQLAVGVLKGETFGQMTRRIVKLASPKYRNPDASLPEQMARGLINFPKAKVEKIVRTEIVSAYNRGHLESIAELAKEDKEVYKRWDSTLDRRGCVVCKGLDGEIRRPDKMFSTGIAHPPQHPYCRCTVVAWKKTWDHPSIPSQGIDDEDEGLQVAQIKDLISQ